MAEGVERFKTEYLPGRRNEIYNRQTSIPDSQVGQIPFTYTTLVQAEAQSTVKVPTDASEDSTWMMPDFDDSSWPTGPTGMGYDGSKYLPLIGLEALSVVELGEARHVV